MDFLIGIFSNPIIVTACVGWFTAQFLKLVVDMIRTGQVDLSRFIGGAGGMPSSHTALVVSALVAVYYTDGPASTTFAVMAVVTGVVMYDALGVRRAAGEQAKVINVMVSEWDWNHPELMGKQLKELLGHTPLEVAAGAVLGVFIGWLMM
ncbi:MAG: divergent PAP2 family protein [Eubacteriales bacterium]|jgi:acid phosphatase family membrane protein YuiD